MALMRDTRNAPDESESCHLMHVEQQTGTIILMLVFIVLICGTSSSSVLSQYRLSLTGTLWHNLSGTWAAPSCPAPSLSTTSPA